MHTRSEWLRKHGSLIFMKDELRHQPITQMLALLVIDVLLMLVEDKINEKAD